jgi:hypothetical protein
MGKDEKDKKYLFGIDDFVTTNQVLIAHLERKVLLDTTSEDDAVRDATTPQQDMSARGTIKKYIQPKDLLYFAAYDKARDLWLALGQKFISNARNYKMLVRSRIHGLAYRVRTTSAKREAPYHPSGIQQSAAASSRWNPEKTQGAATSIRRATQSSHIPLIRHLRQKELTTYSQL